LSHFFELLIVSYRIRHVQSSLLLVTHRGLICFWVIEWIFVDPLVRHLPSYGEIAFSLQLHILTSISWINLNMWRICHDYSTNINFINNKFDFLTPTVSMYKKKVHKHKYFKTFSSVMIIQLIIRVDEYKFIFRQLRHIIMQELKLNLGK
jgi:hypothetical protein